MDEGYALPPMEIVALLAEGVDRNIQKGSEDMDEMTVALLAEGVDRNYSVMSMPSCVEMSPSSRRAWIEIARR